METKLKIDNSTIDRYGVFAREKIFNGEEICFFVGKESFIAEIEERYKKGDVETSCNNLQVDLNKYIDLDPLYSSFNHSCEPNSALNKNKCLIAIKEIGIGEEITYDYSINEWTPQEYTGYDYSQWPMICKCNSNMCRKLITCFPYIPDETKKYYIDSGILQQFIIKKIGLSKEEQRCHICEKIINDNISA